MLESDKGREGEPMSVNVQMSTPGQTMCSLSQHFSLERAVCQPCQDLKSCLNCMYPPHKMKKVPMDAPITVIDGQ